MRCPTLTELPPPPAGRTGWPWTAESPQLPDTMPDGRPWPRVSIVTPSYNQAQFIEETIRSVLLQGYPDLEYIIIDGGSTDGSVEIIRKYEPWLAYWVSERDHGQSHAIHAGIKLSTGDFCTWLNSDDLFYPRALGQAAQVLVDDPNSGFIYRDCAYISGNGDKCGYWCTFPSSVSSILLNANTIPQPTVLMRRSAYDAVGGINKRLSYVMDFDLWLKIAAVFPTHYLPGEAAAFRLHDQSKSVEQSVRFWPEAILAVSENRYLIEGLDPEVYNEGLRRLYVRAAMDFYHYGDLNSFREYFERSSINGLVPWGSREALAEELVARIIRPLHLSIETEAIPARLWKLISNLKQFDKQLAGQVAVVASFWSKQHHLDYHTIRFGVTSVVCNIRNLSNLGLAKLVFASMANRAWMKP